MSYPLGFVHSHFVPCSSSSPSSSSLLSSSAAPPRVSGGGLSLNAKRRREAEELHQADGQRHSPDAQPSQPDQHAFFSRVTMHSPCADASDLCEAFVDDDFCSSFDAPSVRSHAASVSSAVGAAARSPLLEQSDAAPQHSSTPFKWTRGSPVESCSSEGGACSVASSGAHLYGEQREGAPLCFSSSSSSISVRDGIAAITLSRSTAAGHVSASASASAHACASSMLASPYDGELKRSVSDSAEGVPALSHAPHLHHTGLYQRTIQTPTRPANNNNQHAVSSSSASSSSGVVALSTLNSAPVGRAVLVTPSHSRSHFNGADDYNQQHNQHVRPSQRVSDLDVGAHDHEACFMEEDIEAPVAVVPAIAKAAVAAAAAAVQPVKSAHTVVPAPAPRPLSPRERSLDGSRVTGMQRLVERQNVVRVLSCSMEQLCPLTATLPADPMFLSLFHTSAMPGISIREYMERLAIYTAVSEESMITASIHIVRLAHNGRAEAASRNHARSTGAPVPAPSSTHPRINSFSPEPFQVSCFNIHRLLLTALLVTAKYADDAFHNNRLFSSLGGITLREINQLEAEFLHLLDYRMGVDLDSFQMMWNEVFNSAARHGPACCSAPHALAPRIVVEEEPGCGVELDESFFEGHSVDPLALAEVETEQEWAGHSSSASASAVAASMATLKPIPARLDGEVVSAPIFSAHIASAVPSSAPAAPASLVHSGLVRASASVSVGGRPLSVPRVQSTTSTTSLGSSMEGSCDMDVEREDHSVNAAESSESARTTPFLSPQEATVAAGSAAAASSSFDDQVLSAEPPRLSEDKARSQRRHKAHLQVSVHSQSPSSNLGLQRVSCSSLQSVTRCQGIQGDSLSGACTPSPSMHSHHYAKRGAARGGNASGSGSSSSGKHGAHRAEPSVSVSSRYTRAHAYGHHGGFNPYTPSPFMNGSGAANDDDAYDMLM